jgi:predicted DNA binding CopG/RHH family protein
MKKKSTKKTFETTGEMDDYLETHDLSEHFSVNGKLVRPKIKKINLDLPEPTINEIDRIAVQIGVSRQPLLKLWIHERLKQEMGQTTP